MSHLAERRQEEKDRRHQQIVDAAEELYREVGWDAVTMDSVAKRARLSRALVYVYFKDKNDLHCAIASRAMELLYQRFREAEGRIRSGLEKVQAIGRAYIAFVHEFPHYFTAVARLESHRSTASERSPQEAVCLEIGKRPHQVVVEALRIGQHDGSIRKDLGDLEVTARVLWGFHQGLVQIAMTKGEILAESGISLQQLTSQAYEMMTYMLQGSR